MGWPEPDRKRGRSPRATPLRRRLRHAGGPRGIGGWLKLLAGGALLAVVILAATLVLSALVLILALAGYQASG